MSEPIIVDWNRDKVEQFGRKPLRFKHRAHTSELFGDEALAALIERTPRENYYVNAMNLDPSLPWRRREGEIGTASGQQVLEAVRNGRIWVLLLFPDTIDPAYSRLLDDIYGEIAAHVPALEIRKKKLSILISSRHIPVFYHCDLAGQTLWQVRGSKTVYVYPNREPFLPRPNLEKIVLNEAHEISLPYDPAWDTEAEVFTIGPGEMLHWPLHAPHRIDTGPELSVSFTTEHVTPEVRRHYVVNYGNGIIRRLTGIQNLAHGIGGPVYWSRFAAMGMARLLRLQHARRQSFRVDFKVDPTSPEGFVDIAPYEFRK